MPEILSPLVASARGPKDPATRENTSGTKGKRKNTLFVKSAIPWQASDVTAFICIMENYISTYYILVKTWNELQPEH